MKFYPIGQIERLMMCKWELLLSRCWDARAFNGKHQACPICGGGKDRFRWGESKSQPQMRGLGMGICNQCGSHAGLWWFMETTGLSFKDALNDIGCNFLHVKPDSDDAARVSEDKKYPPAPRIKVDKNLIGWQWAQKVNSDPEYDRKYWEILDLVESILMFQGDIDSEQ